MERSLRTDSPGLKACRAGGEGCLSPLQHQRRPGVAPQREIQAESARQIGGADIAFLTAQEARQYGPAAGLERALDVLGQAYQRPRQYIREDEIVGRRVCDQGMAEPRGLDEACARAVDARVLARNPHRIPV